MSSMSVNPSGGAGNNPVQPTQPLKKPIREVLVLPENTDDAALKERVITIFLVEYITDLFRDLIFPSKCSVALEPMHDKVYEIVERLIKSEYQYALKNMDKDIEAAKQRLGLRSDVSKGEVYLQEATNNMKNSLSTIIEGGYRGDYKIPDAIESSDKFYEEMKEVVSNELRKRFSIGGTHKAPENILTYYFDLNLHYAITRVHGYDPEFSKIVI